MQITSRRRVRQLVAGGAIVGILSMSTATGGADAARRTTSESIAAEAGRAVAALDRWNDSQHPADYVRFVQRRDRAAAMTEADIELARGSLSEVWADSSVARQHAVLSALSQLGVPYEYLGVEPGVGFDCSGLTMWAFGEAGHQVARVSGDQFSDADEIDRDEAEPGDLMYYPGHISMYIGDELMVHARNSGSHVEVTFLPDGKSLRFGDTMDATNDD